MFDKFINREWKIHLILFILTGLFICSYFQNVVLNLNGVLASIDGDSLKNYFTLVAHVKNDSELLNFSGFNYPFGEHVVYTDGQPILGIFLKLLPFINDYIIGLFHFLFFFSFVISSNIIYEILKINSVTKLTSFCVAFGLSVIAPQIRRVDGGHYALACALVIPLLYYFLLMYFKTQKSKYLFFLLVFNFLFFLIHPYIGLGNCLVCLFSLALHHLFNYKSFRFRTGLLSLGASILPIVFFKMFLGLTDTHLDRPTQPQGLVSNVASVKTVFCSHIKPIQAILEKLYTSDNIPQWEGFCSLGVFAILVFVATIFLLVFQFKKIDFKNPFMYLFLTSVLLLLFSFGVHNTLLKRFGIELELFNQFRSLGRYAWYFYYAMPIFCFTVLSNYIFSRKIVHLIGVLFLGFNLVEGNFYLGALGKVLFKNKNIFNEKYLSTNEKSLLEAMKKQNFQAILPIPFFHVGSELFEFDRDGFKTSYISFLASYHLNLPIISVHSSRTSRTETQYLFDLLNVYKVKDLSMFNNKKIAGIVMGEINKVDEARVIRNSKQIYGDSIYKVVSFDKKDFMLAKEEFYKSNKIILNGNSCFDTINKIIYKHQDTVAPFVFSKIANYKSIIEIPKNALPPGKYVACFWYHYPVETEENTVTNIFINDQIGEKINWLFFNGVRRSNQYKDFYIWEQNFTIEKNHEYKVLTYGETNGNFKVSNALLRPETLNVAVKNSTLSLINNYPFNF